MPDTVDSTPDPSLVTLVATIIRAALQIASGFGMAWALAVTASQTMMLASAAVMLGTGIWSLWQKVATARREHQIAVASARLAVPVKPVAR